MRDDETFEGESAHFYKQRATLRVGRIRVPQSPLELLVSLSIGIMTFRAGVTPTGSHFRFVDRRCRRYVWVNRIGIVPCRGGGRVRCCDCASVSLCE